MKRAAVSLDVANRPVVMLIEAAIWARKSASLTPDFAGVSLGSIQFCDRVGLAIGSAQGAPEIRIPRRVPWSDPSILP